MIEALTPRPATDAPHSCATNPQGQLKIGRLPVSILVCGPRLARKTPSPNIGDSVSNRSCVDARRYGLAVGGNVRNIEMQLIGIVVVGT